MYDCDANHYHDYDGHALHDYDGQDCGDQYFDGCDDHDFHDDHDGDFDGNDDDGLADYDALSACDEDYHDTIDSLPDAIFDAADPFIDGDNGPPGDCYEGQDDIQSYVDVDMHMATGIDFYTSTDDDVVISSDRDSMVVPEGSSDEGALHPSTGIWTLQSPATTTVETQQQRLHICRIRCSYTVHRAAALQARPYSCRHPAAFRPALIN